MKTKHILPVLIFFALAVCTAYGQSSGEDHDKDPFRNDPFFSKPLDELLNKETDKRKSETKSSVPPTSEELNMHHYVSRINVEGIDYGGALEAGPYSSNSLYGLYPSLPMIHFNRVDALFLGIREERMQWYENDNLLGIRNLRPQGMIGYSFGQREWQYELGLEKYLGFNNHILIGGEYHNATSTDDYWRVGLIESSLTSFLAGYDYLDYYKQKGWGAYLLVRSDRLFEGSISYNNDRFNSLRKRTDFALFGAENRYRANPPVEYLNGSPIDKINVSSLSFSASFNPKRLILAPHFTFSLTGNIEVGDPGFGNSDYAYTKYTGELISYLNFEPGGVFKYRFKAGSITGDAPYLKRFQLGGVGSLRALPYKSLPSGDFSGNAMMLSNAEIHFGSTDNNYGDWIDFDNFYFSLFLDSGWITNNMDLKNNKQPLNGFSDFRFSDLRHNGGLGLGTSSFRVELAWDLNHTSRSPVLWIRLNPTF